MNKAVLLKLTPAELRGYMAGQGQAGYRAQQILDWLYKKGAVTFAEMTNLPRGLIESLEERATIGLPEKITEQVSEDGTFKLLFALSDGLNVETVALPYENGFSVCVSTQVGCKMGCLFCASGLPGFIRNLTAYEIMAQVLAVRKIVREGGRELRSIVLMGSGEPLDNWAAVISFLEAVRDPERLGMSLRHVTLSTAGMVPRIRELASLGLPLTLAVSLHAPNDALRSRIMPVNKKYPLSLLMEACDEFARATGRRVTFEYILLDKINDSEEHARELAGVLRGRLCHVNLIMLNEVPELDLRASNSEAVRHFREILQKRKINATVRRRLGTDIAAACGQLRNIFPETARGDLNECRGDQRQGKSKGKKRGPFSPSS